eukprot:SAG25_NODE_1556_length_2767_cov_661.423538_1_plen_46_part_00
MAGLRKTGGTQADHFLRGAKLSEAPFTVWHLAHTRSVRECPIVRR